MNSMVEHLLNQNLPDHERLGVTPAAQPAEVREAVARLRRALLDPHLTDHFRQQGQSILSDLAPRLHGGLKKLYRSGCLHNCLAQREHVRVLEYYQKGM